MAAVDTEETDNLGNDEKKSKPSKLHAVKKFFYDPETKTVLGRTAKGWLQITIFYLIFYGVLAAFFAVLLILFLQTLDVNEPKWKVGESSIGRTPGMGFRPTSPDSGSTLVWVKPKSSKSANDASNDLVGNYTDSLKTFLYNYQPGNQTAEHFIDCHNFNRAPTKEQKQTCKFNISVLEPCTEENNFGYNHGQPCVLVKLNKVFGWIPEVYKASELPKDLLDYEKNPANNVNFSTDSNLERIIPVTCQGEDAVDKEHIGSIRIHPSGFPIYYYPFTNSPGYLSPVVAVQFLNPTPGVVINVECRAWAKNIEYDRAAKKGVVHIELLVDG